MLNFLTIIISILKYEASADGANRKLIVKNIRRQDVGEYVCKSGESAVTVKLTVGARGASGATLKGEYCFFRFGDFKHFNYIFSFIDWQGVRDSWQGELWQTQFNMPVHSPHLYTKMITALL